MRMHVTLEAVVIRTECAEAKPAVALSSAGRLVVIRTECAEAKYHYDGLRGIWTGCDLHAVR